MVNFERFLLRDERVRFESFFKNLYGIATNKGLWVFRKRGDVSVYEYDKINSFKIITSRGKIVGPIFVIIFSIAISLVVRFGLVDLFFLEVVYAPKLSSFYNMLLLILAVILFVTGIITLIVRTIVKRQLRISLLGEHPLVIKGKKRQLEELFTAIRRGRTFEPVPTPQEKAEALDKSIERWAALYANRYISLKEFKELKRKCIKKFH